MLRIIGLLLVLAISLPSSARELRIERWAEYAPTGGALEAAHLVASRWGYEAAVRNGLPPLPAALTIAAAGLAWEVVEVSCGDALGISVQDLAADAAGILAGVLGLPVRYQYVTCSTIAQHDKWWMRIPFLPRNNLTHALEADCGGWSLGAKFLGEGGDLALGFTSMPVLAGENGDGILVPYMGRAESSGWHGAVGWNPGEEVLCFGLGYRRAFGVVAADAAASWINGELGVGISLSL